MLFKPSPNFTGGRTAKIDRIVIHWIVGTLASADATFANRNSQVSAHYGIENFTVHQYVRESDTAWHAMATNARSIGIEHSAAPLRNATATTIKTSAKLVADICKRYNIPIDRRHIIKHSEVVATACPGTIPIDEIIKQAKELSMDKTQWLTNRNHLTILFRQFVNRDPTAAEYEGYLNKQGTLDYALEKLFSARLDVGKLVLSEAYQKSLSKSLQAQLDKLTIENAQLVTKLSEKPSEVVVTVEKPVEIIVGDDDRSIGSLLSAVWAKLFRIK